MAAAGGGCSPFGTPTQLRVLIGGTASSGGTSASSATLTNGAKLNRAYGGERTKIAGGAARLDAENWVGALYGSVRPTAHAFVDGVFGFGDLDLKTQRNVSANDSVAFGRRDGSMMFGSLAAGIDRSSKRWTWSSYGRVEYLSSQLNAYVERGAGLYSLSFGKRTARSLVGVLGGRAETAVATSIGMLMPRGRIDWRHEFNDGGTQLLDYADLVELTTLHERLNSHAKAGRITDYYATNFAIHEAIILLADNRWLAQAIADLRKILKLSRLQSLGAQGRLAQSLSEHMTVFAALKSRDSEGAEAAMRTHLTRQREALRELARSQKPSRIAS